MNSPIPIWRAGQHLLRGISALCVWGILSSFLQLFRLFSDFKGVQYRTGKCNQYIYNFMSFYLHSKDCFSCRKFANIFCNPFFTFCAIQNLGVFFIVTLTILILLVPSALRMVCIPAMQK